MCILEMFYLHTFRYDLKKGLRRRRYLYKIARLTNKYLCCGKVSAHHHVPNNYFQTSFFSFEPLYRIFFALFSCLGLVLSGYFYCGCMLYVFLKNSVLQYILKAVGKSGMSFIQYNDSSQKFFSF